MILFFVPRGTKNKIYIIIIVQDKLIKQKYH